MAGTPRRAAKAEAALIGATLTQVPSWSGALAAILEDYQPMTDQRATAEYRSLVARNLLAKALLEMAGTDPANTRLIGRQSALEAAE